MLTGLIHSHSGLAYLLAMSTTASFFLAMATAASGPNASLLKVAKILRIVETSVMGLVGLVGIGLWVMMSLPVTTWWAWVGLTAVAVQGGLLARGVKPAMTAAADGDNDAAKRWAMLALVHQLLVFGVIAVMHIS